MESESLLDRLPPLVRQNLLPLALGFLGLIFLGYGLITFILPKQEDSEIVFEKGSQASLSNATSEPTIAQEIVVDIAGAVGSPGVYRLDKASRMQDLITKAGGISESANHEWVAKQLNLASPLSDGAKIYIPFSGEEGAVAGASSKTGESKGAININTASQVELESLPGIGPVTAVKVIAGRPYTAIDELLSKKVVGTSVFEKIKDRISVY